VDLKDKVRDLEEQIKSHDKTTEIEARIVEHEGAYFTLKGDTKGKVYCEHCWQNEQKLMTVNGHACPHCKTYIHFDRSAQLEDLL